MRAFLLALLLAAPAAALDMSTDVSTTRPRLLFDGATGVDIAQARAGLDHQGTYPTQWKTAVTEWTTVYDAAVGYNSSIETELGLTFNGASWNSIVGRFEAVSVPLLNTAVAWRLMAGIDDSVTTANALMTKMSGWITEIRAEAAIIGPLLHPNIGGPVQFETLTGYTSGNPNKKMNEENGGFGFAAMYDTICDTLRANGGAQATNADSLGAILARMMQRDSNFMGTQALIHEEVNHACITSTWPFMLALSGDDNFDGATIWNSETYLEATWKTEMDSFWTDEVLQLLRILEEQYAGATGNAYMWDEIVEEGPCFLAIQNAQPDSNVVHYAPTHIGQQDDYISYTTHPDFFVYGKRGSGDTYYNVEVIDAWVQYGRYYADLTSDEAMGWDLFAADSAIGHTSSSWLEVIAIDSTSRGTAAPVIPTDKPYGIHFGYTTSQDNGYGSLKTVMRSDLTRGAGDDTTFTVVIDTGELGYRNQHSAGAGHISIFRGNKVITKNTGFKEDDFTLHSYGFFYESVGLNTLGVHWTGHTAAYDYDTIKDYAKQQGGVWQRHESGGWPGPRTSWLNTRTNHTWIEGFESHESGVVYTDVNMTGAWPNDVVLEGASPTWAYKMVDDVRRDVIYLDEGFVIVRDYFNIPAVAAGDTVFVNSQWVTYDLNVPRLLTGTWATDNLNANDGTPKNVSSDVTRWEWDKRIENQTAMRFTSTFLNKDGGEFVLTGGPSIDAATDLIGGDYYVDCVSGNPGSDFDDPADWVTDTNEAYPYHLDFPNVNFRPCWDATGDVTTDAGQYTYRDTLSDKGGHGAYRAFLRKALPGGDDYVNFIQCIEVADSTTAITSVAVVDSAYGYGLEATPLTAFEISISDTTHYIIMPTNRAQAALLDSIYVEDDWTGAARFVVINMDPDTYNLGLDNVDTGTDIVVGDSGFATFLVTGGSPHFITLGKNAVGEVPGISVQTPTVTLDTPTTSSVSATVVHGDGGTESMIRPREFWTPDSLYAPAGHDSTEIYGYGNVVLFDAGEGVGTGDTLLVKSNADSGILTLRQYLETFPDSASGKVIAFDPAVFTAADTVRLLTGAIDVSATNFTLDGGDHGSLLTIMLADSVASECDSYAAAGGVWSDGYERDCGCLNFDAANITGSEFHALIKDLDIQQNTSDTSTNAAQHPSADGIQIVGGAQKIAMTDLTIGPAGDEAIGIGNQSYWLTLQYSFIYGNVKGVLVGDNGSDLNRVSFHRNVFYDNGERNPLVQSDWHSDQGTGKFEFRNNVVYGWWNKGMQLTDASLDVCANIVGNVWIPGDSTDNRLAAAGSYGDAIYLGAVNLRSVYVQDNVAPVEATRFALSGSYRASEWNFELSQVTYPDSDVPMMSADTTAVYVLSKAGVTYRSAADSTRKVRAFASLKTLGTITDDQWAGTTTDTYSNETLTFQSSTTYSIAALGPDERVIVDARTCANCETVDFETSSFGTPDTLYTLATVPTVTAQNPGTTQIELVIGGNSNPTTTLVSINETSTGNFVQADSTLGVSEVYQSIATWGAVLNTGLTANTEYTYKIRAKNGDGTVTSYSSTSSETTLTVGSTNYYVAPSPLGDNGNDGFSPTRPLKVIKSTWNAVAAGDTLFLLAGTYNATNQEAETALWGMNPNAIDTVLMPYQNATVVIDYEGQGANAGNNPFPLSNASQHSGTTIDGITFMDYNGSEDASGRDHMFISVDSVTVKNCVFDSVGASNAQAVEVAGSTGFTMTGCQIINNAPAWVQARLVLDGDDDIDTTYDITTLTNLTFGEPADLDTVGNGFGVKITDTDSLMISNMISYNMGLKASELEVLELTDCTQVHITNPTFLRHLNPSSSESSPGSDANGIDILDDCDSVWVSGGLMRGMAHGYDVAPSANAVTNVWISDCIADSTQDDGFFMNGLVDGGSITSSISNVSYDNAFHISGDNIELDHVTAVRSTTYAIHFQGANPTLTNSIVYDVVDGSNFVRLGGATGTITIDYNLYFDPDGSTTWYDGLGNVNFTNWVLAAHDENGYENNPLFISPNASPDVSGWRYSIRPASVGFKSGDDGTNIGYSQVIRSGSSRVGVKDGLK